MGRSFFPPPRDFYDLGDFYELWLGLFQSTVLGRVPYVNVDVAHKAFPTAMKLTAIVAGLYQNTRGARGDLNTQLDRYVEQNLVCHLRGLRILYEVSGQAASKKSYKFLKLSVPPAREEFMQEDRKTTVAAYFQSKGIRLQYPNLPCVRVGNDVRKIALPMEFCSIPPGQVCISYI